MFSRFWCKTRFCKNRCPGHSFWARSNFLAWGDAELMGLQNCSRGFPKFSKMKIYDKSLSKKKFENISKNWVFENNAENTSKSSTSSAPVAIFSFISQKMAESSGFSFFQYNLHYATKIQMHILAWTKRSTRKRMVSLDFWAQTACDRHLFIAFGHIKNWPFST